MLVRCRMDVVRFNQNHVIGGGRLSRCGFPEEIQRNVLHLDNCV